ncbi:MAG: TonB C-terminal domain-containing protein [Gammaproteobacteria bacterium]|nr:TonB C-terminal domain-containing protein [Gammaproteobacteria bacterium]MDH3750382.1 TonB C-terminal domain-containing protein [Gammaproteobacteria bacterium]MDH3803902.1 TonB C-terminal domain-containing protein [Gammaproteobacteria bacterium]
MFRRAAHLLVSALLLLPALTYSAGDYRDCSSSERATYTSSLRQAVISSWLFPEYARDVQCTVIIAQNFRGEVLNAGVEDCGDDLKLIKSAEDAAYRASPLPRPANRACFVRKFQVRLTRSGTSAGPRTDSD